MRILTLLTALAAVAALALPASSMSEPASPTASTLTVKSSRFGRILFDGRGFVLYAFTRDPRGAAPATARAPSPWPPYLAKGRLRARRGCDPQPAQHDPPPRRQLQVTYAGRLLYCCVGTAVRVRSSARTSTSSAGRGSSSA